MKKLLLILLIPFVLNAQFLELMQEGNLIELNQNPYFANWSYTELVTNGTFNSESSWTLTPNTAISSGTLNYTAPSTETPYQFISLSAGKVYQIKFDLLNYTSGNFRLSFSGASYLTPDYHVSGSYAKVAPYVSSGVLGLASYVGFTGSIDNISVSELVPPTGFTSSTMDATNYVIQSNGCKFVEATGTTYIETSTFYIVDLILLGFGLVIGYYARKIKDWFKLMAEEFEETFRKENNLFD